MRCVLCGLEIPKGQYSREHYVPRSKLPDGLAYRGDNIYPAVKIVNNIKGNLFPCEWKAKRYFLIRRAVYSWNIKPYQRSLLRECLKGMPDFDPCELCICKKYQEYCVKNR